MITPADAAAWQNASPVALNAAQAEQEMLLRRLIIELGNDPLLAGTVVCSGGHDTAPPAGSASSKRRTCISASWTRSRRSSRPKSRRNDHGPDDTAVVRQGQLRPKRCPWMQPGEQRRWCHSC